MLYVCKSDPDYNMIVRTTPVRHGEKEKEKERDNDDEEEEEEKEEEEEEEEEEDAYYRWHVVLFPHHHDSVWAGVRSYGEFAPNRGTPEDMAAQLRSSATPEAALWALSNLEDGENDDSTYGDG